MRFVYIVLFISTSFVSFSQTKEIDSCNRIIVSTPGDDSVKAATLSYVATLYQSINLKKAEETALSAISMAERLGDESLVSKTLSRLGSIYVWMLKTTEALQVYVGAIEIAKKINNDYLLQDVYDGLEYLYEVEEEWDKALTYSLKSMEIAEKLGNDSIKAYSYHGVGSVYYGLQNYDKAEVFIKNARSIFLKYGELDRTGTADVDLAKVYIKQKRYDEALVRLDTALVMFTTWEEPYQSAEVYQIKGEIFVTIGKYNQAEKCFYKSMELYKEDDVAEVDYERSKLGLGTVYLGKKNLKAAENIFEESYKVFKKNGDRTLLLNCLTYMSSVDSALGNFQSAFEHQREYNQVYKEREQNKRLKAAQRLIIEFEVAKKEEENRLLKEQNERNREKIISLLVAGIIVAIGIIWLGILYKHKKVSLGKIRKLQAETDRQNGDLQVMGGVKDKLISMIAHDVRSPLASLKNTITLTRQNILNKEEFSRLTAMLEMDIYHLMGMLDNTLQWARNQMQGIQVKKEVIDLNKHVDEIILLYQQTSNIKGIKVINSIQPNRMINSDKEILNTVLRNVLSNAIKFTPPGKNVFVEEADLGKKLMVQVRDEGVGIDENILRSIKANQFVSTRGTLNEKGTGLGLLFSKELVKRMGEEFNISTEAGKGTTVAFSVSA